MTTTRRRGTGVAILAAVLTLTGLAAPAQANPPDRIPVPFVFFDTEVGDTGLVWFVNTTRDLYCGENNEPTDEGITPIATVIERQDGPPAGRALGRGLVVEVWPLNEPFVEGGNGCSDTSQAEKPFASGEGSLASFTNDVTQSGNPPLRSSTVGRATITADNTQYMLRWWNYRNDRSGIDTGKATLTERP